MELGVVMSKLKELPVFAVIIALTFLVSGAFMSFVLLLTCVLVWPFSRYYYRQISYYLIYPVWAQLVFLIDWWAPTDLLLYVDEKTELHIGKEHAMVVMNHSYDVDWLAGWLVCERFALLAATKVFAKRSLSYVPVIGWLWKLAEIIFLDRNWQKDRSCIVNQIAQISEYKNPVWILLFPEGTRFTQQKHANSVEFANKEGLPILKYLLTPRTKGFVLTMQAINESGRKIRAIYDTTIAFSTGSGQNEPTLMNLIKGKPAGTAHIKVHRIPVEDIPQAEEACIKWMHDNFQRKDNLLDGFFKNGHFEGRRIELPRRPYTLINEICWVSIIGLATIYYVPNWWVLAGVAIAVSVSLQFLSNVTVSSKGSTYGNVVPPS